MEARTGARRRVTWRASGGAPCSRQARSAASMWVDMTPAAASTSSASWQTAQSEILTPSTLACDLYTDVSPCHVATRARV